MLHKGTCYRRLPILVAPDGSFYTPTYERDYTEGEAIADCITGKGTFCFQNLSIREGSLFRRSKWVAGGKLELFEKFPDGWKILEGRPYMLPKKLTPEQAKERV